MAVKFTASSFVPQAIIDKLNSAEVIAGIQKLFAAVGLLRKASLDTKDFRITAWTVSPVDGGKRAVNIRIEEM